MVSGRPLRRLLIALAALVALDPFVPGLVRRLEATRYESGPVFRFENSDLFSLGPLAQYLREHPRAERPRVVFFGNSMVWGYFLEPEESLPAQFQRLTPGARVFNLAVNGFETGSAYVVTKRIIDAVDTIYLFPVGAAAHPMLPRLVPVEAADLARFRLAPADRVEASLESALGFWRLYRDAYRLQSGLFGTSSRVYVYRHKASALRAVGRGRDETPGAPADASAPASHGVEVAIDVAPGPVADERRRELARTHPLLWDYAELVRAHGKRAIVVQVRRYAGALAAADWAELNAVFRPHVSFVELSIPPALSLDGRHLSAEGARAVASALRRAAPAASAAGARS